MRTRLPFPQGPHGEAAQAGFYTGVKNDKQGTSARDGSTRPARVRPKVNGAACEVCFVHPCTTAPPVFHMPCTHTGRQAPPPSPQGSVLHTHTHAHIHHHEQARFTAGKERGEAWGYGVCCPSLCGLCVCGYASEWEGERRVQPALQGKATQGSTTNGHHYPTVFRYSPPQRPNTALRESTLPPATHTG